MVIFADHGEVDIEGADHILIGDLGRIIQRLLRRGIPILDILHAVRFGTLEESEIKTEIMASLARIIGFEIAKKMTEEKADE